jgi:hypothetical protein
MNRAERKAWLADLKFHDEVAVFYGREGIDKGAVPEIRKVKRDGSSLWVEGSYRPLDENGCHRDRGKRFVYRIEPVTEEVRLYLQDRDDNDQLSRVRWRDVPVETRRQIAALLRATTPKQPSPAAL